MERWIHDGPDLAGRAVQQFVQMFFRDNALLHGPFELAGAQVDLARIEQPLLNVYALHDALVPPAASRALAGLTGSRGYAELVVNAGHIGVYVSRRRREPEADE